MLPDASNVSCFTFMCMLQVPTGIAAFPKEIFKMPKAWAYNYYNLQHWTEFNKGGHFAAKEQPELLAEDVQNYFGDRRIFGRLLR